MKIPRASLIRALEIALGAADLESEKNAEIEFSDVGDGLLVYGQTGEAAGWDVVDWDQSLGPTFLAPGRPLLHVLREIREPEVDIWMVRQELHVEAENYHAVIWSRPGTLQPEESPATLDLELERNLIGELGRYVAYARPKGRHKSVFPGIHVILSPQGLKLVATDGRRLALAESDELTIAAEQDWILPGRFLLLTSRYLDIERPTRLCFRENRLEIHQGRRGIASTILAGPMPAYKALLPGPILQEGWLRRGRAIEAIRQARLFSARASVRLDECKLYVKTPETSEGMAEISVGVEWTGSPYRTQLNMEELLEALESMPGEEIAVAVQGERVPIIFRDEDSIVATLMPMLW